jgi:peptidoglycan/LPS O-acetylase OafA/YrhL
VISDKPTPRFAILDFSRLLAAIFVVTFHISSGRNELLNLGYLAVDFFFVLSGFVLSPQILSVHNSKELCTFVKRRYRRLIPNTFLSLLIILLITIMIWVFGSQNSTVWTNFGLLSVFSYLTFTSVFVTSAIALNYPIWSLSTEFIVSLGFGLANLGFRKPIIRTLAVSALPVAYLALNRFVELEDISAWIEPILRTASGFAIGFLTRQFFQKKYFGIVQIIILSFAIYLIVVKDLILGMQCLSSILIFILCRINYLLVSSKVKSNGATSGELSFIVYLLHVPMLGLFDLVVLKTSFIIPPHLYIQAPMKTVAIVLMCLLILKLRTIVTRKLVRK